MVTYLNIMPIISLIQFGRRMRVTCPGSRYESVFIVEVNIHTYITLAMSAMPACGGFLAYNFFFVKISVEKKYLFCLPFGYFIISLIIQNLISWRHEIGKIVN